MSDAADEPVTREAWDAAYRAKHRDYKGKTRDGRRSMLWSGAGDGTVLLVEPEWPKSSGRVDPALLKSRRFVKATEALGKKALRIYERCAEEIGEYGPVPMRAAILDPAFPPKRLARAATIAATWEEFERNNERIEREIEDERAEKSRNGGKKEGR